MVLGVGFGIVGVFDIRPGLGSIIMFIIYMYIYIYICIYECISTYIYIYIYMVSIAKPLSVYTLNGKAITHSHTQNHSLTHSLTHSLIHTHTTPTTT